MPSEGGVHVEYGGRLVPLIIGAVAGAAAFACWFHAPWLYNDNLELRGLAWFGLILMIVSAAHLYSAYRRAPILKVAGDGLYYETLTERRLWRWQETGPFSLCPLPNGASNDVRLVAMYPGNIADYERLSGRAEPDFVDADIVVNLSPFFSDRTTDHLKASAESLLDRVNASREAALAHRPLDSGYVGSAQRGIGDRLRSRLRFRRAQYYIPMIAALGFTLYSCANMLVR